MGLSRSLITFTFLMIFSISVVTGDEESQTFIVRVHNDLKPSQFSHVEEWYTSTLKSLRSNLLSSEISTTTTTTPDLLHVYKTVFHGFSTKLTDQQVQELKIRPEILGVFPDQVRQIQTTRSPLFLGLTTEITSDSSTPTPSSLLTESDSGSNVVIGILDTGISPERRSFNDDGLDPIPSHWKGECTEGENFTKSHCNKKLVGARFFSNGYEARHGVINQTLDVKSARDTDGHGTHTASTAAGAHVSNASLFGYANGNAVGIAPKARIAAYKICWTKGCMDSDILAAFDKAVDDGVDVISLSVGGGPVPYQIDPIAIGSFGAIDKGVIVSAAAGNDGPDDMTVTNVAPWILTVGASTIDRNFPADLVLENGLTITGASFYSGSPLPENTYLPLVYAGTASSSGQRFGFFASTCYPNSLDTDKVRGKIVVCDRGGIPRVAKGKIVKEAGGVGVVVANVAPEGEGLVADSHVIPGLAITESAGNQLRSYISSSQNPRATMVFRGTQVGIKPAPVLASFSSRGPNPESIYVVKPDLIAPGVNILAAWPDGLAPTELSDDTRRSEFNILSGTSMSCPHVSGLAALLKGAHPDWSPAMVRSSLMTTAYRVDHEGKPLLDEKSYNASTVWGTGAGHVDPEKAVNPGLVYDLTVDDYVNYLCAASDSTRENIKLIVRKAVNCSGKPRKPWNLNYPVISVAFDTSGPSKLERAVVRTVTHVGGGASSYTVSITSPPSANVKVYPGRMVFQEKGQKQSFVVRIKAANVSVPYGDAVSEFGSLTWTDGKCQVTTPIVVSWQKPN